MTTALPHTTTRVPTDRDLAVLHANLVAARSAAHNERCVPQRAPGHRHFAAADLLDCMEAYVEALTVRRLPVPPRLRDELRLRRQLS